MHLNIFFFFFVTAIYARHTSSLILRDGVPKQTKTTRNREKPRHSKHTCQTTPLGLPGPRTGSSHTLPPTRSTPCSAPRADSSAQPPPRQYRCPPGVSPASAVPPPPCADADLQETPWQGGDRSRRRGLVTPALRRSGGSTTGPVLSSARDKKNKGTEGRGQGVVLMINPHDGAAVR